MSELALIQEEVRAQQQATTGDGGGDPPLSKAEVRKFKKLCQQISSDVHLQAILQTVSFDRREAVYNDVAPWLKFKAKPFNELRFF